MALPTIFAGLRIAASSTVGIAGFAFFAGAGGLGGEIFGDPTFKGNVVAASLLMILLATVAGADRAGASQRLLHPVGAGGGVMILRRARPLRGRDRLHLPSARVAGRHRPGRRPRRDLGADLDAHQALVRRDGDRHAGRAADRRLARAHRPLPVPGHQHLEHRPRGPGARSDRVLHRLPGRRLRATSAWRSSCWRSRRSSPTPTWASAASTRETVDAGQGQRA